MLTPSRATRQSRRMTGVAITAHKEDHDGCQHNEDEWLSLHSLFSQETHGSGVRVGVIPGVGSSCIGVRVAVISGGGGAGSVVGVDVGGGGGGCVVGVDVGGGGGGCVVGVDVDGGGGCTVRVDVGGTAVVGAGVGGASVGLTGLSVGVPIGVLES